MNPTIASILAGRDPRNPPRTYAAARASRTGAPALSSLREGETRPGPRPAAQRTPTHALRSADRAVVAVSSGQSSPPDSSSKSLVERVIAAKAADLEATDTGSVLDRVDRKSTKPNPMRKMNRSAAARQVAEWLALGRRKGEIKKLLREQYDGVGVRRIEDVITLAKRYLAEITDRTPEDHKVEAYNVYRSMISNPDVPDNVKVMAQKRIDRLYGLEQPMQIKHTVDGDMAIREVLDDPEALQLADALADRIHANANPSPN